MKNEKLSSLKVWFFWSFEQSSKLQVLSNLDQDVVPCCYKNLVLNKKHVGGKMGEKKKKTIQKRVEMNK